MLPQFDREERALGSTEFFNFAFKVKVFKGWDQTQGVMGKFCYKLDKAEGAAMQMQFKFWFQNKVNLNEEILSNIGQKRKEVWYI